MGPKTRSKSKAPKAPPKTVHVDNSTDEEEEVATDLAEEEESKGCLHEFRKIMSIVLVCIDLHLGTPVFGFRDSKTGKFFPQANFSFTVVSFCDGDRFSFPSWQLEVQERTNSSLVLVPDYMEKGKEITTYISSIIKRSLFSTIPNKKFKDYFKAQLIHHIDTRDVKRLIVSYTGASFFSVFHGVNVSFSQSIACMAINHNPLHVWQFITIHCMHGNLSQSTACMAAYHNPLHVWQFITIHYIWGTFA